MNLYRKLCLTDTSMTTADLRPGHSYFSKVHRPFQSQIRVVMDLIMFPFMPVLPPRNTHVFGRNIQPMTHWKMSRRFEVPKLQAEFDAMCASLGSTSLHAPRPHITCMSGTRLQSSPQKYSRSHASFQDRPLPALHLCDVLYIPLVTYKPRIFPSVHAATARLNISHSYAVGRRIHI